MDDGVHWTEGTSTFTQYLADPGHPAVEPRVPLLLHLLLEEEVDLVIVGAVSVGDGEGADEGRLWAEEEKVSEGATARQRDRLRLTVEPVVVGGFSPQVEVRRPEDPSVSAHEVH